MELIYTSIEKLNIKPPKELLKKWNEKTLETVTVGVKQAYEFERITKTALEQDLCLVALKGSIIKSIYPIPEIRTMGDFDILIKPEAAKRIKEFFMREGYKFENDAVGYVFYKGLFHGKVFNTIGEEFRINTPCNGIVVF